MDYLYIFFKSYLICESEEYSRNFLSNNHGVGAGPA